MNIITTHKSPNYWRTSNGNPIIIKPWVIVIHATAAATVQSTLGWFKNPDSKASAHYVVDKNGDIYQMVEDTWGAWHAGASRWKGIENLNLHSIGIEVVNDSKESYPEAQIKACAELVKHLVAKYKIKLGDVVRHSDISGFRGKTDPYAHFPWETFKGSLIEAPSLIDQWEGGREAVNWALNNGYITQEGNIDSNKLWTLIVLHRIFNKQ